MCDDDEVDNDECEPAEDGVCCSGAGCSQCSSDGDDDGYIFPEFQDVDEEENEGRRRGFGQ